MDIKTLKAELFDLRQEIDSLEAQKQKIIGIYNEKLRRLYEFKTSNTKTISNGDSEKQAGEDKVIPQISPNNSKSN